MTHDNARLVKMFGRISPLCELMVLRVTHWPHHSYCATPTLCPAHLSPSCLVGFSCTSDEHTTTLTFLFHVIFIFHQWENPEIMPDSAYQQHPPSSNLYPMKKVQLLPHSSDLESKILIGYKVPHVPEPLSTKHSLAWCCWQNRAFCYF